MRPVIEQHFGSNRYGGEKQLHIGLADRLIHHVPKHLVDDQGTERT